MLNLKHPNIVQCEKVFEADRKLNMVLEYCEGRDLDHLIAA